MINKEKVKLSIGDSHFEFPLIFGTFNEPAIDIGNLRDATGYITYDRGFKNTASVCSSITYLNGEEGKLTYRGYPVEELATSSIFPEVIYLLIYGRLPEPEELVIFQNKLSSYVKLPEIVIEILENLPSTMTPMLLFSTMVGILGEVNGMKNSLTEDSDTIAIRLLVQSTIVAANINRKINKKSICNGNPKIDFLDNFIKISLTDKTNDISNLYQIKRFFNKLLIIHADHEQNCSTATVRLVGSSGASLHASLASGINALSGPLHGGANQEVIEMLETIVSEGNDLEKWITKAKDKNDSFRLMGFGHRVYKNFDPRAQLVKQTCREALDLLRIDTPLFELAKQLESTALKDPYFLEKKLYPNVDFYSGIIYKALGFPNNFFTVLFAVGRLPGWIAQWQEMKSLHDPIGRPRQIYCGSNDLHYNLNE